jgi:phosphatidyl-myo-inositol alpha-mannosyltransferase
VKIGFVLDDTLDKPDGVQQYVLTLGRWLSQRGHTVVYLAGETKHNKNKGILSLARNISVRFNKNRLSVPLPVAKKKIKKVLKNECFDVLHVQMPYSPFFAARIIDLAPANTAVVGTFHILPYSWLEKFASKALALATKRSLQRIDAGISVSAPAANFAEEVFNFHTSVVPNTVDLSSFIRKPEKQIKNKQITVVYLGRLVERKGIRQLLKAVNYNASLFREKKATFIVCGGGPLDKEIKRFIKNNKLEDLVYLKGFIGEKEKYDYLSKADVAVFPSISGESFGIVLIEAMMAGSRVILGGNNPGYSSVLNKTPEALFDPCDIKQFSELLVRSISDQDFNTRINNKQQSVVNNFDVNVVGQKILGIYKTAIAKRSK